VSFKEGKQLFKIKKGKIYDIEATGLALPYGTKTGWE
jgi:hypothetical protein